MSRSRSLPCFPLLVLLAGISATQSTLAAANTLYVAPAGSDSNSCLQTLPCREIRRGLALAGPGDTVLVADGSYKGFDVDDRHGNATSPIVIKAQGTSAVVVKTTDRSDNRDTIFISFSSYIVIDGLRSSGANRAAVRVSESQNVTIRNCVLFNNATWGIFTDFSDDLLIENNETYGSVAQHGIYFSNSGDRPVIRGNRSYNNTRAGIHMNGDVSSGGDGIITGALVENNIIYNNGSGGAAGINMDGIQDSTIRNNLIYNNHATGISLYQIDGAEGPKGNKVYHNTVHQAADGRYALLIWQAAGANTVRNNVLYHPNSSRGGITHETQSDVDNTDSDYNVLDRVTPDDGGSIYTLAEWQAQGHETHSLSATPAALFVNAAGGDYHLKSGSPAIDRGQTLATVTRDIEGNTRPLGASSDVGAYEANGAAPPVLTVTPTSLAFGSVNVGSGANLTVTVKNTGGGTLAGTASTAAPFSVVGTASYSLAANQTATITVRFSPTVVGNASGTLALTGAAGGSVSLGGTGATTTPVLTVTPTSLAFGSVNVGSGANLTVTVKNTGGGTLAGTASTAAPFSVVGTASYSLAANQTATITVRFSPTVVGNASGTLALTGGAGASVGLTGTGVTSTPGEPVAWMNVGGVSVVGNNLTKTAATAWGNAGAVSTKSLASGDGYVEHTVQEVDTYRMLGLSHGDSNLSWDDIDFSLYPLANGTLHVYEKGMARGVFGTYATGDKLRVAVTGGVVRYYRNGTLLYTSPSAPTYPLLVDTSLYNVNSKLKSVVISGNWTVATPPAFEPVVWTSTGGVSVSANTLTKTAAAGWGNAGGVSTKSLASGNGYVEHTVQEINRYRMLGLSNGDSNWSWDDIDFALYLLGNGTLQVYEQGTFRGAFGTYATGDKLRVAVTGGVVGYYRNGSLLYTSPLAPTYPLLVDTSLYNVNSTLAGVVISGNWTTTTPPVVEPVVWTSTGGVSVSGNTLTKTAAIGWGNAGGVSTKSLASGNGYVEHTVQEIHKYRMLGLSHGDSNWSWDDIDFSLYPLGDGTLHVYEKGTFRGAFGTYATGDKLRVAVTGGVVRYYRNGTLLYTSPSAPTYPLLVDTSLYNDNATLKSVVVSGNWTVATPPAGEPVVWTSTGGVSVSGNTLTKTAASAWGNAGAVSTRSVVSGDGDVEVTVQELTTARMFGLSNGNTDMSFQDIDFAIYITGANLQVYEKGSLRGTFGACASGDKLRVSVGGNVVRYSRNGTVFYTSATAPAYPLLVDTALHSTGATLVNVMIAGNLQ